MWIWKGINGYGAGMVMEAGGSWGSEAPQADHPGIRAALWWAHGEGV